MYLCSRFCPIGLRATMASTMLCVRRVTPRDGMHRKVLFRHQDFARCDELSRISLPSGQVGDFTIDLKPLRYAATIGFNDDLRLRDQPVSRGAFAVLKFGWLCRPQIADAGRSTLMTSASRSSSSCEHHGPGNIRLNANS